MIHAPPDARHLPVALAPMRARHLAAVLDIERRSYPTPWPPEAFRAEFERTADRYYLVARSGRRVVGYGGLMLVLDVAHVTTLAVHPDRRGVGIGSRLLVALLDEARRRGAQAVTLEVRVSNRAAAALYRRFGFVPAGTRRRYYHDGEDAIIMWLRDLQGEPVAAQLAAWRTVRGGRARTVR